MYHKSGFGSFGVNLPCDIDGFVPEKGDNPFDGNWDHGSADTHDDAGRLTEYGEWWRDTRFPESVAEAKVETEEAEVALQAWRENS